MTRRTWWPRRRRPETLPDQSLGWALVHLGTAVKAHQEGDVLRAVRHLALAAETIAALIDQWTAPQGQETPDVPRP